MGSDFKKIFKARGVEPEETQIVTPKDLPPAKRKGKGKRSDPNFTQVSAYSPKDLHRRVKIELMEKDQDFSELVTELLTNWLEKQ